MKRENIIKQIFGKILCTILVLSFIACIAGIIITEINK